MKLTAEIFNSLERGDRITHVEDEEIGCDGDEFIFPTIEFRVNRKYGPLRYSSKHDYDMVELYVQESPNLVVSLLVRRDDQGNKVIICDHGSSIKPPDVYERALNSTRLTVRKPSKIPNPA